MVFVSAWRCNFGWVYKLTFTRKSISSKFARENYGTMHIDNLFGILTANSETTPKHTVNAFLKKGNKSYLLFIFKMHTHNLSLQLRPKYKLTYINISRHKYARTLVYRARVRLYVSSVIDRRTDGWIDGRTDR